MSTVVRQETVAAGFGGAPDENPRREVRALARRVLIVGLDGATFDILDPMMAEGFMPHLAGLMSEGTSGVLESTKPPITPAAWTTFMTGKGPGRHGIVDFEKYDAGTHSLSFNSTFEIREKTIWEMLSEKGFRVGSLNLPMTYPPSPVNGFLVSGFETPGTHAEFTYPPELKDDILRRWPDYSFGTRWRRRALGGEEVFESNLRHIKDSFHQGGELARMLGEKYGWDAMMVLFKLVDNLQHKAWKYLDPRTSGRYPARAAKVAGCFRDLDQVIAELADYAESREATLLIMSDHGHGSLDGKAQPNLLLQRWRYLTLKSNLARAQTRSSYVLHRLFRKRNGRFATHSGVERELAVDWTRTQACVMHAGIYGFLYLNLRGRQPCGVVPAGRYESLRDELRERLLSARCRDRTGRAVHIFPEVHKPEELYHCSRSDNEWLPDLLLVPAQGLAVVRKIRGFAPVRWCSARRLEGTHRVEGILVARGPHVRRNHRLQANIVDITPTLLSMLGLRVPIDMEGRVLAELFDVPPVVEHEPPKARELAAAEHEVYTEEEKRAISERLSELGYLE